MAICSLNPPGNLAIVSEKPHNPWHRRDHTLQEGETARLGEAWKDGVVVLSWDDVRRGASGLHDGHNVVLHEFAHQLDQQDGSADGTPTLEHRSQYTTWARVLGRSSRSFNVHGIPT